MVDLLVQQILIRSWNSRRESELLIHSAISKESLSLISKEETAAQRHGIPGHFLSVVNVRHGIENLQ